jgi:putative DNA primase/helicase
MKSRWLLWQGHRWYADEDRAIFLLAKEAARERYRRGWRVEDPDEKKKVAAWAIQSESHAAQKAALALATAEPPIADNGRRWDADPWLLGLANGVRDLRSELVRPGTPADRITLSTCIMYDPQATAPRWCRFILEIADGDAEIVEFLQRAAGYSLTGSTAAQVMFLMIGAGSNGKSLFQKILRHLGGEYSAATPFSTFEQSARGNIPSDLAALAGKRIITCSESAEGVRLNESRLKAFAHGDEISARFMNRDWFSYLPVGKLWFSSNHRPVVRDDSLGFWRSVLLIPFHRQFLGAEADPDLEAVLLDELPGILNWALEGCREWQKQGLNPPASVRAATDDYRAEQDPLTDFITECCIVDASYSVGAGDVYKAYTDWTNRQGFQPREIMTTTTFGKVLGGRFTRKPSRTGNVYHGIGLQNLHQNGLPVKGFESSNPSHPGSSSMTIPTREK